MALSSGRALAHLVVAGEEVAGALEVREDLAELVVEVGVGGEDRDQRGGRGLGLVVAAHQLDEPAAGLGGAHEDDPQRLVVHRRGRPLHEVVDGAHLLLGHRLVGEGVGRACVAEEQVLGLGGELEVVLGELGLERGQGVVGLGHG